MSRWLVSQGDRQFAAKDLDELKQLATKGTLAATDMIQPPGASDWLYASEIPELKGTFKKGGSRDDLYDEAPQASPLRGPLMAVFLLLTAVGAGGAWYYANLLPDEGDLELIGEGGLAYTDLLVTQADAPLLQKPDGSPVGSLEKDSKASMLGKRDIWYHIRTEGGEEGYVKNDHVIPAYFFGGKEAQEEYDPLYNPDRYLSVQNASWMRPDPNDMRTTLFEFLLQNKSKFEMTGVVLVATIKNKSGAELERVEIPIEGVVPRHDATGVGTLMPEKKDKTGQPRLMTRYSFDELVKQDATLYDRWMDSIEVKMKASGASDADIDLLEVRAVPTKDMPK